MHSIRGVRQPGRSWRGWPSRAGSLLRRVAAILVILVGTVLAAGAWSKAQLRTMYPAPGRMVGVSSGTLLVKLHIACQGMGSPTVIMEAGQGESSLSWSLVQSGVARTTRVCVYDRAGLGWSDRSKQPRLPDVIVDELHALLANAGIGGPYVLVGHSMGGLYSRLYVHTYPQEVAGLVLVDATHEQLPTRQPAALGHIEGQYVDQIRQHVRVVKLMISAGIIALHPSLTAADTRLPPAAQAAVQALNACDSKGIETTMAEFLANDPALAEMRAAKLAMPHDLPLIVLTRGHAAPPPAGIVVPTELLEQREQIHRALQGDVARGSSLGKLVVAQHSGHAIQLDQPAVVIDAIKEVVAVARRRMQ